MLTCLFHLSPLDPRLAQVLIDEFPCRPHWTKNTREVFGNATKNIDPSVSNANVPNPQTSSLQD